MVVERAAVGEPGMGRDASRVRRGHVVAEVARRRRAAVVDHDRRAAVVVALDDAERAELADLRPLDLRAELAAQALACRRRVLEAFATSASAAAHGWRPP